MQISMIRGDIKWLRFIIQSPDGELSHIPFTNIFFTVRSSNRHPATLIRKTLKDGQIYQVGDSDYQMKIASADTKKLLPGSYKFDIQVVYKNLIKESFPGDLFVDHEITIDDEDEEETQGENDVEEPDTEDVYVVIRDTYEIRLGTPDPVRDSVEDHGPISQEELEELTGGANADAQIP